ncbi:discoidin domain-containing protein [Coraliomargarita sinensis]|nr:discoidin domain-containing protein [Coraliomargarita sinensis]
MFENPIRSSKNPDNWILLFFGLLVLPLGIYLNPSGAFADSNPGGAAPQEGLKSEEVHVGAPDSVMKEMEARFGVQAFHRNYSFDNPTYAVTYGSEEEAAQRKAGAILLDEIQAAIDRGDASYTAEPGFYRFAEGGIRIDNAENFTLNIANCDFMMEAGGFLGIENSKNITVKGPCTVDSTDLTYVHGRIEALDEDLATVYVPQGYAISDLAEKGHRLIFDSQGRGIEQHQSKYSNPSLVGDRSVQVSLGRGKAVQVGNIIVMDRNKGVSSTLRVRSSYGITVDGIDSYVGGGWDVRKGVGDLTFRNIRLRPAPGTNRIHGGSAGQFLVTEGFVLIDGCEFGAHTDDGINLMLKVNSVYQQIKPDVILITGRTSPKIGNTLTIRDYETGEKQSAVVSEIAEAPGEMTDQIEAQWRVFCESQDNNYRDGWINKSFYVKLKSPVEVSQWSWVFTTAGPASGPDSFVVRNSYFHDASAEPITLKAAKRTLIENCLFIRNRDELHAGSHFYWWEGPLAHNVTIRKNVFRAIPMKLQDVGVLRFAVPEWNLNDGATVLVNIIVENNSFYGINTPAVSANHVHNLVVRDNYIELSESYYNGGSRSTAGQCAIYLDSVSNGSVTGNVIKMLDPERQIPAILAKHVSATEIRDNEISHLGPLAPYITDHSEGSFKDPPLYLLDGDYSTSWTVTSGYPAWVIVDLNTPSPIDVIKVTLGSNRAYQYKVETSNMVDAGYETIVDQTKNRSHGVVSDSFDPVTARYVKFTVTGADGYGGPWIHIKELGIGAAGKSINLKE